MARATPVKLATIEFGKKADALKFFQEMLQRYQPRQRVSPSDSIHLAALLELHTENKEKVGCGIDHFEVMAAEFGTQCFCIVRTNGSRDDFSYKHCITPKS